MKAALRKEIKRLKQGLTPAGRLSFSQIICQNIELHPLWKAAQTVLAFYPLPDEPDLRPLLERYYQTKRILLPVVQGDKMVIRLYEGQESLREGAFRIFEPQGQDLPLPSLQVDLVLVPGVAFDAAGHRLGRGKGYYDQFFASCPQVAASYKLGIAFPFQIVGEIPTEPHDIQMDEVIEV